MIERGHRGKQSSWATIQNLARALGVTEAELLNPSGQESPTRTPTKASRGRMPSSW